MEQQTSEPVPSHTKLHEGLLGISPATFEKCAFALLLFMVSLPILTAISQIFFIEDPFYMGLLPRNLLFNSRRLTEFFAWVVIIFTAWYTLTKPVFRINNAIPSSKKKLWVRIKESFRERPWLFFVAALLIWQFISALFAASNKETAFWGDSYRFEGMLTLCMYACIFYLACSIKTKKLRQILLISFVAVSFVITVIGLLFILEWEPVLKAFISSRGMSLVFFNSNHCAYYFTITTLTVAGMFVLSKRWYVKLMMGILFILEFAVLTSNNTLGGFIAVICGCFFSSFLFLFSKKCKWYMSFTPLVLCVLLILIYLFVPIFSTESKIVRSNIKSLTKDIGLLLSVAIDDTDGSENANGDGTEQNADNSATAERNINMIGTNRMGLWRLAVQFAAERPILGYGPEQLGEQYARYAGEMKLSDRPHNEYLQYAAQYGFVGLALYLSILVSIFVYQMKRLKQLSIVSLVAGGAVIGYLISAFFGNTMYYTMPPFILMLALCSWFEKPKEQTETGEESAPMLEDRESAPIVDAEKPVTVTE